MCLPWWSKRWMEYTRWSLDSRLLGPELATIKGCNCLIDRILELVGYTTNFHRKASPANSRPVVSFS